MIIDYYQIFTLPRDYDYLAVALCRESGYVIGKTSDFTAKNALKKLLAFLNLAVNTNG